MIQSATQDAASGIFEFLFYAVIAIILLGTVAIVVIVFVRGFLNEPLLVLGWFAAVGAVVTLVAAALIPDFSTALIVGAVGGLIIAFAAAWSAE